MIKGLFGSTLPLLERAMDLRSRKHEALISNIANQDTPNFKAFDVMVEENLQKISNSDSEAEMVRTHRRHLNGSVSNPSQRLYQIRPESGLQLRKDGNTVDIDREMAQLSENNLMYNASAQIVAKKFQSLMNAIKGGK